MSYSFVTGLWKTVKNGLVVLLPAFAAGWLAFVTNVPPEYQPVVHALGGFVGYFFKNLFEHADDR